MGEMVERAARAAWEENRRRCAVEVPDLAPWEEETDLLREDWRALVRTVIEAMREPTKAMVSAGRGQIPAGHGQAWMFVPECYAEMIADALS